MADATLQALATVEQDGVVNIVRVEHQHAMGPFKFETLVVAAGTSHVGEQKPKGKKRVRFQTDVEPVLQQIWEESGLAMAPAADLRLVGAVPLQEVIERDEAAEGVRPATVEAQAPLEAPRSNGEFPVLQRAEVDWTPEGESTE